ncbi:hypothetical protein ACH49O_40875 [Streptomyces coeruleorubidus]|uniref:hypothetical protein n=1 Tax=Streptomyces coeruleorubidus TaxID=116188 RepID=UPI0033F27AC3
MQQSRLECSYDLVNCWGLLAPLLGESPPAQRARLAEIRDALIARIAEAETEGWLGEVVGLRVSLAGAEEKLRRLDQSPGQHTAVDLGVPITRGDR